MLSVTRSRNEGAKRLDESSGTISGTVGPSEQSADAVSSLESNCAPVAQLDRAPDFESVGRRFESCRAYHFFFKGSSTLAGAG